MVASTANQTFAYVSTANQTFAFIQTNYPSMLEHVPNEVLDFGLPNHVVTILASFITLFLSLISLFGNLLLIILYSKHSTLRTSSNKLVLNLSFSNSLMHFKSWILIINGFAGGPILGKAGKGISI